jgi:hypothetical protein
MIRAAIAATAWTWASVALAQPLSPDLIQSLNAAVFVPKGSGPAAPATIVLPSAGALLLGGWGSFSFAKPSPSLGGGRAIPGGGATFTLWSAAGLRQRLEAMGVKDGDRTYGGQGRFYLFAAVHGQAVGLNLLNQGGALQRAGWSTDTSSALVGDGQLGFGWRKGAVEADLGYVHRSIHFKHTPIGVTDGWADDMAAVSFTFRPRW